jgi:hypothetical protein
MEVMKKCLKCNRELPIENFATHVKKGRQAYCRECQKAYRRNHYLKNKQKYITKASKRNKEFSKWWRTFKSSLQCEHCKENHPACLQFHHTHDNKEASVACFITNGNKTKALEEIKKCIVLCANCHFKLHDEINSYYN